MRTLLYQKDALFVLKSETHPCVEADTEERMHFAY